MRFHRLLFIGVAAALYACTAGQTTAPPVTQVNPLTNSHLQLVVGTANLYGAGTGLNVVSTMRQPSGMSATLVNTPVFYGPFSFTAPAASPAGASGCCSADLYTTLYNNGPSIPETHAAPINIGSTSQGVHPGTPFCDGPGGIACPAGISPNTTTFGQSGGVFAMGIAPYNTVNTTGQSYSYSPYPQPIYAFTTVAVPTVHVPYQFTPWGGPPAFDPDNNGMGTRDGLIPLGADSFNFPYFLGVGEGITVFDGLTVRSGVYALNVQIAYLGNNAQLITGTLSASANLSSLAVLPTITSPTVVPDASGGANVTVTLPGGVSQAYVQIIDYGPAAGPIESGAGGSLNSPNCQSHKGTSFAPVYYTLEVTSSGTFALGALHGPNIALNGTSVTPSPSICTAAMNNTALSTNLADNFTVQMIGFDYPAYQAAQSLVSGGVQAPTIAGPSGQSDITISQPIEYQWSSATSSYGTTPLSVGHRRLFQRAAAHWAVATPQVSRDVYKRLGVPPPRYLK